MKLLKIVLVFVPLAAAAGWSVRVLYYSNSREVLAYVLVATVLLVIVVFFLTNKQSAPAPGLVIGSSALLVCASTAWVTSIAWFRQGGFNFLLSLPEDDFPILILTFSPLAVIPCLWPLGAALLSVRIRQHEKRRLARSDLHGKARFLDSKYLRRLARRRGILLGQKGRRGRAPLIAWDLEGAALTLAPPRCGKGATIALNYLSPGGRGFEGSTVLIDPRGETFCVVARRRRDMGRRVILLDPMGVVEGHAQAFGDRVYLPDTESASYNPLDFIRGDEARAVRDIDVLLDALLTPPADDRGNSRHFHESARAIIGGYMAWTRFGDLNGRPRTLKTLHELLSLPPGEREELAGRIRAAPRLCGGLPHMAVEREAQVGKEEGGSNFTTIANQLAFMSYPEMTAHTAESTFDPFELAGGDVDLFVVAPEEMLEHIRGWLRLWITIPVAVAGIRPLERDMLVIIDEMPRLGFLKPVMDGYNMAAGKGVHFWCFTQGLAALDDTWGRAHRKALVELAEVVQVLGCSSSASELAEELSRVMGHATFESRSESRSATLSPTPFADAQSQVGEQYSVVRERLVPPERLRSMSPDEQYVIAAGKDIPRDPMHLNHARYWSRPDTRLLADPNPFVERKRRLR